MPLMLGQLVFNSIAILEEDPSASWSFERRSWIASSMEDRDRGDEEVMLIMNGFDEVGSL